MSCELCHCNGYTLVSHQVNNAAEVYIIGKLFYGWPPGTGVGVQLMSPHMLSVYLSILLSDVHFVCSMVDHLLLFFINCMKLASFGCLSEVVVVHHWPSGYYSSPPPPLLSK